MVKAQRVKISNGQMGDKRFEDEGEAGVQHEQRKGQREREKTSFRF